MSIVNKIRNIYGALLDTDSYKMSHADVYNADAKWMTSYFESRGGEYDEVVFVGMQYILQEYFTNPLTHEQVDAMRDFALEHCTCFPEKQFRKIVTHYNGHFPVIISSVDEGTVVPAKNVLMTIESQVYDPDVFSVVSYLETKLMRLWYPTTIASMCYRMKKNILGFLEQTTNNPKDFIGFMVNDFGLRGTTDLTSGMIGGFAHLTSFLGTDNIPAVLLARECYGEHMAGYSIAATEHSIMTSQGVEGEEEVFARYLSTYGNSRDLIACVIDSYNYQSFCKNLLAKYKDVITSQRARLVVRPDSGNPLEVPLEVIRMLADVFGYTINDKGFKVLHDKVRVIQGDGVDEKTINVILAKMIEEGWCVSNICFGIGGSLLQKVNRDTNKFAIKCSQMLIGDKYQDVFKAPFNEPFKKSKAGKLFLVKDENGYSTVNETDFESKNLENCLKLRYYGGTLCNETTLSNIRSNTGLW